MQPYDIVKNPLKAGACLIEAGAGTGKTYALTAIFLRLLLETRIDPDRILMVTFTTAATAELRDRLRRQLIAIRRFLDGEGSPDETLKAIVERCGDAESVREGVVTALREFDRIAIFTIHGFCQRLLSELAFETDSPFEIALLTDPSEWVRGVADDYWREAFYAAPPELVDYALTQLRSPEALAIFYQRYGIPDLHLLPVLPVLPEIDFEPYRQSWASLRRLWPAARDEIVACLQDPALNGTIYGSLKPVPGEAPTKRAQKVAAWGRTLDHFLQREVAPRPVCPALVYFTRGKIVAATRKGQTPPDHAFFDASQALYDTALKLQEDLDRWLAALRYRFFDYAKRKLGELKRTHQTLFFDDLLVRVRRMLQGPHGHRLASAVRRRYQAALVDEFQDTDTIQYAIFKRLFDTPDHLLFMIGDPKQAIYGFRGADIFSYLQAARQARDKFTLVQNWRSRPELIRAINRLFTSCDQPFLLPEIVYHPAVAAPHSTGDIDGPWAAGAMTFWMVSPDTVAEQNAKGPISKSALSERVLAAVASKVGRLLNPPPDTPDAGPSYSARDIAILVRTNRQARMVKTHLQDVGIPAVIHNAGSVFDTPEADAFEQVLRAVAQPGNRRRLKTALATRFFGVRGDRLAGMGQGSLDGEEIRQRFQDYQVVWRDMGFYPFFQRMLTENQIAGRLLMLTDGERRLTNLLHLGELTQQATAACGAGLQETLKWLREQRTRVTGNVDSQQLRIESDARALTILTIHKSKGLEFPIVFCPFSWESDTGRDGWPLFHDPAVGMRRTLYIGVEPRAEYQMQAERERLAESLRLLYVAVTRARARCYLVWGDVPGKGSSALGYLLRGGEGGAATLEDHGSALERLAQATDDAIMVQPLPEPTAATPRLTPTGLELQPERRMKRRLDLNWSIASFSSLIRMTQPGAETPEDHDGRETPGVALAGRPRHGEGDAAEELADDIHLFPRGVHAGNLFHRLFEILDYRCANPRDWHPRVASELVHFGFEPKWTRPITHLIQKVLATPLPAVQRPFSLNQLDNRACLRELPFSFPLKRLTPDRLRTVFRDHDFPLPPEHVDRQLEKLHFNISGGYLRGFIDLVFFIQDRYYLLDWKSNHLGDTYDAYDPVRIRSVMAEDYYFLQYHLYAVALDRYLRLRCPDYAYEKNFGGIYYLFIRGMQPDDDKGRGVFFDRPQADFIKAMSRLLCPGG